MSDANSSLGPREWLCLTRPSADVLPFCPPSGSRIQETRTRSVSFSPFGLGTPRFTQLDFVITEFFSHHPESAVRFRVRQSRSNLIYKTIGMAREPRPLVGNPWIDHTSIWCFFSRRVECWMSKISGGDHILAARIMRPLARSNWRIRVTTLVKPARIRVRIVRTFRDLGRLLPGWIV